MIVKIALRNIFRQKRRVLITIFTMAVGFAFFIFFDSMFLGIDKMLIEEIIKYQSSSVVMYSKDYDKNKRAYPLNKTIKNTQILANTFSKMSEIDAWTFRTEFISEIISKGKSKYVVATAIDVEKDKEVFDLEKAVKNGKFLANNASENYEILIGKTLAEQLEIEVGDVVTLRTQTKYETHNALDFIVCGILETSIPSINESSVIINFLSAKDLLEMQDEFTSIYIKIGWPKGQPIPSYLKKVEATVEKLNVNLGKDFRVYSFKELYADFILLIKQKRISSNLIVLFLLFISAVGVVNTILMAVYERVKEIGIMIAMGFNRKQVKKMFLLEGFFIGILGTTLGSFLGFLINIWLIYKGWNLDSIYGERLTGLRPSQIGMPVWGTIYGEWNIYSFVFCFLFGVFLSVIAAYYPASLASKKQVTECLKFN